MIPPLILSVPCTETEGEKSGYARTAEEQTAVRPVYKMTSIPTFCGFRPQVW